MPVRKRTTISMVKVWTAAVAREEEPQKGAQNQDLPPSESITEVSRWKLHQGVGEKNDAEKGSSHSIGETEFLHDHAEYGGNTHSDEVEGDPSKPHSEPYGVVSFARTLIFPSGLGGKKLIGCIGCVSRLPVIFTRWE